MKELEEKIKTMIVNEVLSDVIEGIAKEVKDIAIEFAKWLLHLDNGTTHYNPETKETTASIGFSPYDCFVDKLKTPENLFDQFIKERYKTK